ncbi:MAG: folate family ECF transporter S component [Tissierellia bacterium]|nr:folate family ECF transporter S component [Tissierellia bacterium]
MGKLSIRNLVYYALLIALNVILTRFFSIRIGAAGTEAIRIGFGGYPVILAGIIFGPIAGGIVGAVGDIVGMIISPMGPFMPHFTLVAALTGIIPGLIMMGFKEKEDKTSFWKLLLAIGVGQIVTSVIMTPYFMQSLFSIPMVTTVPGRAITQAIQIPLYAYVTKILASRLSIAFQH